MTTHPNILSSGNSLLVVVDIQSRLLAAMSADEAGSITANVPRLLEAAGFLDIPVLVTEQYPKGLGPTDGAIAGKFPETTPVFTKTGFSCCAAAGFSEALSAHGRRQVILTGLEAHVCVLQTALELRHLGYQVHVVEDGVASRKVEHKFHVLQRMRQQGITITNYESVLFEWLKDAMHPQFKRISAWLR